MFTEMQGAGYPSELGFPEGRTFLPNLQNFSGKMILDPTIHGTVVGREHSLLTRMPVALDP